MTDFAKKYGFALAPDSSDSDEGTTAAKLFSPKPNETKKPVTAVNTQLSSSKGAHAAASSSTKMGKLLQNLLSDSDSDSDTD